VGDHIEVQTSVSFMEAAKGTSKTINITPLTTCKTCTGSGMKPGRNVQSASLVAELGLGTLHVGRISDGFDVWYLWWAKE